MNLKDCLVQYCDTKEEIKELEKKIRKLENNYKVADVVEASSAIFPFAKKTLTIENIDYITQRKVCSYKDLLKARYDRLLEQQLQVEEFIDKLPTSRLRQIFEYRYIDNNTWVKVAMRIGNGATSDCLRMEHDRFLEKN
ncbi:MAG: hypothetical protein HFJ12_01510 [Bacilli bacterium]|nr:hypothetical protein [Bacilli bacterium]